MKTANPICRSCGSDQTSETSFVSHDGPRLVRIHCRGCDTSEVHSETPKLVESAANTNRLAELASIYASFFIGGAVFSWIMG